MLLDIAKSRKTVRKFKSSIPPLRDILYAIEVAKEAPSGMNAQPWLFYIISNKSIRQEIRDICEKAERIFYEKSKGSLRDWLDKKGFSWKKPFLEEAPYLVLAFSYKKSPFSKESVWISIGYFLLALEEKKLATVTYTPPNSQEIAEILNTPKDHKLEVIMPVGYSADSKPKYERKRLEDLIIMID